MENRTILVDTSLLIDFFRKKNKKNSIFYSLNQTYTIYISAVTEFEFLAGVGDDNTRSITHFFESVTVCPFDSRASVIAGSIYRNLKSRNQMIEFRDIFIGATAIAQGLPIATLNEEHFKRIENLEMLSFSAP